MKKGKVLIAALLTLALSLSMVACGGSASSSAVASSAASTSTPVATVGPADGEAEYAVILKVLSSQFWQTMRDGIEAKAQEMGIKVDIYASNTEDDVEGQVTLLENAVSKGYKAIGVAPISDVNLNNAIADAIARASRSWTSTKRSTWTHWPSWAALFTLTLPPITWPWASWVPNT